MNRIFSPIVSVALAISLTAVSCIPNREEMDSIKNELAALKDKVAANEADVNAQLGTLQYLLQSYKDEVNPQLVALDAQLKKDYASLSAADEALSKALKSAQSVLMAAISKNADDIAANKKDIQAAITEYKKLVADAVAGFEAALKKAREDQAVVDGTQDLAIEALYSQFDTCKEAIDEAINNLGESVEELATAVEEMEGSVEDLKEKVDANFAASLAYTDALEASVKATLDALEERIAANEAAIKKLNEETIPGIENTIETLQSSIEGLEGNLPALEEKKLDKEVFGAFLKEHSVWKRSTDSSIQGINESIEELKAYDAILAGQVEHLSELVNMLNGDETVDGSVKQQIKDKLTLVYKLIMEDLNALKTDLEGKMEALENDVKGIQNVLALTWEEIAIINGNLEIVKNNITAINGQIATAQGDMQKLREAKTELENKMAALQASIESRSKAIEELVAGLEKKVEIINGDKETEGSIAYAVEQLRASVQAQLAQLPEKVSKNAQEIAKLKEEMGKLQQYIQSLVFVPQYQDLKFGIPFTKIDDVYKAYNAGAGFVVVYKVAPANLAKDLAQAVNDAIAKGIDLPFHFDIDSDLQTRAADTNPQLIIKDAVGDEGTGKITFFLSHKNFDTTGGNLDKYTVSLRVDNADYNVHVASEYVQAKLHLISSLSVIKDHIYKPDVTTGEADQGSAIAIDNDENTPEGTLGIEYTDGKAYTFFEGYEMAAQDEKGVIRTYSQWRALGYDIAEVTTTVTEKTAKTTNIVADLTAKPATFSVKIKDGAKDNMVKAKYDIAQDLVLTDDKINYYNYAFSDGVNTLNAQALVGIKKHTGTFHVKVPYTMRWEYIRDAQVDFANRDKNPAAWEGYVRSHYLLEVTPTLTVGTENRVVDGSNKVFGLTVDDFAGKSFAFDGTPFPAGIIFDFNVNNVDSAKKTISLTRFEVKGVRLGETYSCTGTYNLPPYSTGGDSTTVTITTVDRYTGDIQITVPAIKVKLLGDQYNTSKKSYDIKSVDFSDALMAAYKAKGVLPPDRSKDVAFGTWGEFDMRNGCLEVITTEGIGANFDFETTIWHPYYILMYSKEGKLKSDILHQIASGSDCENKPWTIVMRSRVGLKIYITWPISVEPLYDYRFVTTGINIADNSFQVPIDWVGGPAAITQAKTELELINKDNANISVMYSDGTSGYTTKPCSEYNQDKFKLIPRFSLVNATEGVAIDSTITAGSLRSRSLVKYYSQAASVAVKSALYVKSDNTEFYVPGSDKMYVNGDPMESITLKQANPIAATQANPENPTNMGTTGVGTVLLTMRDVEGRSLYANGLAKGGQVPYATGTTIKQIYNPIKFSVYSVNGSTSISGWSIYESDTPDDIQLQTNGVAAGPYTVVIKASTVWKDYYYTVKVNVQ